jgi:hypothetical protein
MITPDVEARFWAKVDRRGDDECWLWTGTLMPNGYARLSVGGRAGGRVGAHRLSYELHYGPIPDGLVIDHVKARGCEHRHCVNPAHLEAVTQRENTLREETAPATVNSKRTHCIHGHEFTASNTYIDTEAKNRRVCRKCVTERGRKWRAKQKAAALTTESDQ